MAFSIASFNFPSFQSLTAAAGGLPPVISLIVSLQILASSGEAFWADAGLAANSLKYFARTPPPDSLPCIGTMPEHDNLFAAFGHSHYGFRMAPNTRHIVAGVVSGEPKNVDLKPYWIDRFR